MLPIILASSSIYRKELLQRLTSNFDVIIPDVNEKLLPDETPKNAAIRLAILKAKKISINHKSSYVIGSDQTAEVGSKTLKKTMNIKDSFEQLIELSGKDVIFYSAVCIINESKNVQYTDVETVYVKYKILTKQLIENYLNNEKPIGCLGSIKSEGLGITLLEKIVSNDPTAIVGMPLLATIKMFEKENIIFNGK